MASSKLIFILSTLCCILVLSVGVDGATHHHHEAAAPAPSVDCSTLVLNMADCLSFVSNDSTSTKPEGTCCSGLKTVLSTDAECLCEAFKSSAQLGVVLNIKKALSLPAACKLHAPSATNCGLSLAPAGSPGLSPLTAGPPTNIGANEQAPAPSPGSSGSHGLSVAVGSLVSGLLIALLAHF